MAETNLEFSKIVSTPTPMGWSQAYNAGHLFAVFSLQNSTMPEGESLTNTGKDLISTFESEFFTLDSKNLETIKSALLTTASRIPESISLSFVVCFLTENILYLFATGSGKAILKRAEKIGTVLEATDEKEIKSASGYVKEEDLIVLQTKNFHKIIPQSSLASALDNEKPEKIAEELAPLVHEKADGAAGALILSYKDGAIEPPVILGNSESENDEKNEETQNDAIANENPEKTSSNLENIEQENNLESESTNLENSPDNTTEETVQEKSQHAAHIPSENIQKVIDDIPSLNEETLPPITNSSRQRRLNNKNPFKKLPRGKKTLFLIALILVAVIIIAVVFGIINKNSGSQNALFDEIYTEAQAKYEEGQSLRDLNASLSQQNFQEARDLINSNINEFDEGSDQHSDLSSLLAKIENELNNGSEDSNAKEVNKSESKLLSYQIDNPKANFFTESTNNVYFLDGTGASRIDKGNNEKEQVVKKSFNEGGIGSFGSNFYVLDKDDGIFKYAPSGEEYVESDYFSDAPDLKNAAAMGIDGSIFILFKDGEINKFTKGTEDDFSISGLEKGLSSPTRIFTNEDSDNIYILDSGNSRVVVLDKDGKFVSSYTSNVLKSARDIDVNEADKKLFILSNNKVYQIDLK